MHSSKLTIADSQPSFNVCSSSSLKADIWISWPRKKANSILHTSEKPKPRCSSRFHLLNHPHALGSADNSPSRMVDHNSYCEFHCSCSDLHLVGWGLMTAVDGAPVVGPMFSPIVSSSGRSSAN